MWLCRLCCCVNNYNYSVIAIIIQLSSSSPRNRRFSLTSNRMTFDLTRATASFRFPSVPPLPSTPPLQDLRPMRRMRPLSRFDKVAAQRRCSPQMSYQTGLRAAPVGPHLHQKPSCVCARCARAHIIHRRYIKSSRRRGYVWDKGTTQSYRSFICCYGGWLTEEDDGWMVWWNDERMDGFTIGWMNRWAD